MTAQAYEYDKIADILKRYKNENLEKQNFYGVITYLGQAKAKSKAFHYFLFLAKFYKILKTNKLDIQLTVVDETCQGNERLKCNLFVSPDLLSNTCEIGDIIRCHRFKVIYHYYYHYLIYY